MLRAALLLSVALTAPPPLPQDTPDDALVGLAHVVEREGQRIHVWERALASSIDEDRAAPAPVVVLLHGGTWSGRPDFDLDVEGSSTMVRFAEAGWDAFCVDVQGYGESDDPVEPNWCEAKHAALDVGAAIDAIRKLRGARTVSLVGWSWGSLVAGTVAASRPDEVDGLVLYGTRYRALDDPPPAPEDRFRENTAEAARSDFVEGCHEPEVADAFVRAALAADPDTPNGVFRDYFVNLPVLEPERLTMPTMVIAGEHEAERTMDDMLALVGALAARDRRLVVVPGGGHAVHLENGRDRWHAAVLEFLER